MEWQWSSDTIDSNRVKRAMEKNMRPSNLDAQNGQARFGSSSGDTYSTSLRECSCRDFLLNLKKAAPCKHMLRLAFEMGIVNANGLTAEQQKELDIVRLKTSLATAFGYYYLLDESIVSNQEYDENKKALLALYPDAFPCERQQGKADSQLAWTTAELIAQLQKRKIVFKDLRASGGSFWIERSDESERLLFDRLIDGRKVRVASSCKVFDGKPALYV